MSFLVSEGIVSGAGTINMQTGSITLDPSAILKPGDTTGIGTLTLVIFR